MNVNSAVISTPLLALLLLALPDSTAAVSDDAAGMRPLTCHIEYWSVGHLGEKDDDGWLLAWKAKVKGDLDGELRYWFPETPPVPEGKYSHGEVGYYLAKWELWSGDKLVLAGESAGKTVIPNGEDGIWDGHGIVLQGDGQLGSLVGRKIYETGTVIMPADPAEISTGSGMFMIY